jgi:tetratricopeptide (TPR) repeat protein
VEVFEGRTLRLDLGTSEDHLGSGVKLHGCVEVTPKVQRLRVLVRDEGDAFYLDEGLVPFAAQETGPREAIVVFPDAGKGWINVDSTAWDPVLDGPEGIEIGGIRFVPEGRPVVATASEVSCFVVTTRLDLDTSAVSGRLHSVGGREIEAGSFEVVDHLTSADSRFVEYALKWSVPELEPDLYELELSLPGESGDPIMAKISVIAVPPEIASEHPTWVAYAGAPPPAAAPRASRAHDEYSNALELCVSDRWDEGVAEVFELERSAIGQSRNATVPAELFKLEATAIKTLADNTMGAIIPLLVLHHDVFMAWTVAGDSLGQEHSIRVIAAMANDIQKQSTLAPATATAVGVLSSIGNTLYKHGISDSALEVLELALALDPNHQASLLGTAADHEWFGHYDDVVRVLDGLGESSNVLFEVRLRRGVNLLRIGRTRDAMAELQACTHSNAPVWIRTVAYEELALVHLDNDRPEKAGAMLEEAIALFPRETTLRLLLAYTLEVRGQLGEARGVLAQLDQQAVTTYRESPRRRYARWPSEVFEEERRSIRELAAEHLGDLAAAMAANPALRGR